MNLQGSAMCAKRRGHWAMHCPNKDSKGCTKSVEVNNKNKKGKHLISNCSHVANSHGIQTV